MDVPPDIGLTFTHSGLAESLSGVYLKNLRKHIYTNGILPRRHGNAGRAPHNALTYEDSQNIVQFIIGSQRILYADRYGMPQPAARGVTDVVPPIYLPAQDTYDSVYNKYQDVAKEMNFRGVTEPCFRNVWKQCVPHIQFVRLRTDVCHVCEKHRKSIQEAVTEDEKLQISESFAKHIQYAQLERDYYKTRCKAAEEEQKCGNLEEKKNVHYTFDFAQSVLVPGHVRQEGALYYKLPFKVNWFGILNDGKPAMYNYIFSEAQAMSVDNENSHSSSSVVSMFDHFLTMYGEGEKKCFINCDNCGGQNKNQTVIAYFCWRTMLGYHDEINLHFMQPYHARCQIDAMFGLGRQKLRKNDLDSVSQVADVLAKSCKYSNTVVYNADRSWVWRDWKTFLSGIFRSVPGVRQYFHFRFSSSNPGHVIVKKFATSEELNVRLLKRGKCVTPGNLPVRVEAAGLSPARQCCHLWVELEAEANVEQASTMRLSEPEVRYCIYMMEKHGDDFKVNNQKDVKHFSYAMARDSRNYYQDTPKQIKRKINKFKSIPDQYNAYLRSKEAVFVQEKPNNSAEFKSFKNWQDLKQKYISTPESYVETRYLNC
ncbi:hypothetical protein KUTeg_005160 [Tegillarca granosa]|uniref:DUF7869 domain-containing protein n=1 Tax=Tegillarca granosa TaxID=220873 RepID=A0ABQ9FIZ2_TEGGR|nr:hypothetical protein KUTeg_005160 [Tegillarca granosa]